MSNPANNSTFIGRVGRNAEVRYTAGGQAVSNFSIAVDRFKKNAQPLWISVTLWGKLAESISQYIVKGKLVAVSGEADLRSYETKGGEQRTELTVNAQGVKLLAGGRDDSQKPAADDDAPQADSEITDQDIPF